MFRGQGEISPDFDAELPHDLAAGFGGENE
jgi:hypothetical protein